MAYSTVLALPHHQSRLFSSGSSKSKHCDWPPKRTGEVDSVPEPELVSSFSTSLKVLVSESEEEPLEIEEPDSEPGV